MEIKPIAYFSAPFKSKFGVPRQSGVVKGLRGKIRFEEEYVKEEALRGLEDFEYVWLIWEFSMNESGNSLAVRPPRLGGNEKVGVFASRSPFRPNRLGLSCVKLLSVDSEKGVLEVSGADLADHTPIYDIKPYVAYCDAHPDAKCGFVDDKEWKIFDVIPSCLEIDRKLADTFSHEEIDALFEVLAQDPRPQYHKKSNPSRSYGLLFYDKDVKFHVEDDTVVIDDIL